MDEYDLYSDIGDAAATAATSSVYAVPENRASAPAAETKPQPVRPPAPAPAPGATGPPSTTPVGASIFLSSLQWWTTDVEVEELCAEYGIVLGVRFIEDKACGKSRGMAVVDFASLDAAERAIQGLNGRDVNGRTCKVTMHHERGGGGGGGGGRSQMSSAGDRPGGTGSGGGGGGGGGQPMPPPMAALGAMQSGLPGMGSQPGWRAGTEGEGMPPGMPGLPPAAAMMGMMGMPGMALPGMDMMMPQMMAGYGMQAMQAPQGFKPPPPRGPPPPTNRH